MTNINGTPGSDTLAVGNSNDTIESAEGDDLLPGGGGGDSLEGSADSDTLIGDHDDGQPADASAFARLEDGASRGVFHQQSAPTACTMI